MRSIDYFSHNQTKKIWEPTLNMSLFKQFWGIIEKPLAAIGSICSIAAATVMLCVKDSTFRWIALLLFSISLIVFLVALIRVLNRYLDDEKYDKYKCITSFISYTTDDDENIVFDLYKVIQVKCAMLKFFDVGYKWSGKKDAHYSSTLQNVEFTQKNPDSNSYDTARLKLKKPALYNEATVIHLRQELNDVEKASIPKVEIKVEYPIDSIQTTISLGYKDSSYNKTAKIERRLITSEVCSNFESIDSVPFDKVHKQYTHTFVNPEPGYYYRIIWER